MNHITKFITASVFAITVSLALTGCGESSSTPANEEHSADDDHTHAEGDHDHDHDHDQDHDHDHDHDQDHDHAEADHEHDHEHGDTRSLGTVEIAGTTLAVTLFGEIEPSAEVHLDFEVTSGSVPAAIRFWIGDEAGTGALKSKADAHDDHFHGHTESPASLTDASLWIEVQTADGSRHAEPVAIN